MPKRKGTQGRRSRNKPSQQPPRRSPRFHRIRELIDDSQNETPLRTIKTQDTSQSNMNQQKQRQKTQQQRQNTPTQLKTQQKRQKSRRGKMQKQKRGTKTTPAAAAGPAPAAAAGPAPAAASAAVPAAEAAVAAGPVQPITTAAKKPGDWEEANAQFNSLTGDMKPILTSTTESLESDEQTNETLFGKGIAGKLKALKKEGKFAPKKARDLYEKTDPDNQCENCIGKPKAIVPCYICKLQMKNLENSGFYRHPEGIGGKNYFLWTGRQCEHIIPVLMMAIICGLCDYKGGKNPISPDISIDRFFKKLKKAFPEKTADITKLMREYKQWQDACWELSYAWSHTECNMVKREFPFLDLSFNFDLTKDTIELNGVIDDNIKKLLKILLMKNDTKSKWSKVFRMSYRGELISGIREFQREHGVDFPEAVELWINDRVEKVKNDNLFPLIEVLQTNPLYFNISLSILKDTICESIGNDSESINVVLESESLIAKLIDISRKHVTDFIRGRGQRGGVMRRTRSSPKRHNPYEKEEDPEIETLAMCLLDLSRDKGQPVLRRTTTMEGAEGLALLSKSEPNAERNEDPMSNYIKRLVTGILQDKEISEIIAGAIYLMYMRHSKDTNNPYSNAIHIVNDWVSGVDESQFQFLVKRIKAAYGEIKILGYSGQDSPIKQIQAVNDVLIDINDQIKHGKIDGKTTEIFCGRIPETHVVESMKIDEDDGYDLRDTPDYQEFVDSRVREAYGLYDLNEILEGITDMGIFSIKAGKKHKKRQTKKPKKRQTKKPKKKHTKKPKKKQTKKHKKKQTKKSK